MSLQTAYLTIHTKSQSLAMICQATHNELLASRNEAYMRLYVQNIKLTGSLETLEYVSSHSTHALYI